MVTKIQQPYRSPAIVLILNRIHEMDQPYASGIADSLGEQVTDIQTYLDTMHERGWISKEKSGRRQVISINPDEIWRESKYHRKIRPGGLFDRNGNEKEPDPKLQRLLNNALLYKLFYAVEMTTNTETVSSYEDNSEVWIKGPDTLRDNTEMAWYGCDTTLNELLAEIVATLKTISLMTDGNGDTFDVFTSAYDKWFVEHCSAIFQDDQTVDDFEDLVEDMVENPLEYV